MPLVEPPTPRRHDRLVAALVRVTKPLFRLHLALYEREVARAPFPRDARRTMVDGPDPDRLLFVGSIAVEGFGVLDHDLTCASQTARLVAAGRSRGVTWNEVSSPVLTAAEAARTDLPAEPADAAVVLLGICDVLLATGGTSWEASLRRLAVRVRESAGPDCRVVYVGIPPMAEFRPIPPVAARLLTRQIDRLNAVTARVALTTPGASWVPFPEWRSEGLYHQELLSWATMHRRWGQAIAPTVVASLGGAGAGGGPREGAAALREDHGGAHRGSDAGPVVPARTPESARLPTRVAPKV